MITVIDCMLLLRGGGGGGDIAEIETISKIYILCIAVVAS